MKICSAIMGSGKSQGCIQFMNENKHEKFIYIAPYLDETERIQEACPELHFVTPGNYSRYNNRKIKHIEALLRDGRNIAATHQAFRCFTLEMLDMVKKHEYILIMDEVIDIMKKAEFPVLDVRVLVEADMVRLNEDTLTYEYIGGEDYANGDGYFPDICRLARCNNLYLCTDKGTQYNRRDACYYFLLPLDFIRAFKEVYVLTYLFEGSELWAMCEAFDIHYEYIGIEKIDRGTGYILSDTGTYVPGYVKDLKNHIHVYEDTADDGHVKRGRPNKKLNTYYAYEGKLQREKQFNLSHSFYMNPKNKELRDVVRANQRTFFDRMIKEHGGSRDLCQWGVYKNMKDDLKSWGLQNQFVSINARATNDFADRCYLSYLCNLHIPPEKIRYYKQFGIEYNEDAYALSTLIQWIWRSRIRLPEDDENAGDIWVYIPAKRMRDLYYKWVDAVTSGEVIK